MCKLSETAAEVTMQGSYIRLLSNTRTNGVDDNEARQQSVESQARIDAFFNGLDDVKIGVVLPGLLSLRNAWNILKTTRSDIAAGRDIAKNREMERRDDIAFSQELAAEMDRLQVLQLNTAARIQKLTIAAFLLALLALVSLCFIYHRCTLIPLQRMASRLTLALPPQTNVSPALQFPDPAELDNTLARLDVNTRENTNARDAFFASMSHEIRTPLNGIIGFLATLSETDLNQQQSQYLGIIDSSARSLLHVIDEVLDFSKINAGKLELENIAFDLASLIDDRVAMASQLLRQQKNVKLVQDGPDSRPLIIRSDPMRLRQVLDNLLSNAAKFTERGEITLTLKSTDVGDGCLKLTFSVADTGIGMSPQEQERLFKPYSQTGRDTARRYGGTGLGLAISADIVKRLGGELTVTSRPAEGSVFSFSFIAPTAKQEEQLRLPGNFQVTLPINELKRKFALLVDDTPTNLFLLETICQGTGLPYRTAQNGLEAIKLCREETFDIIFMDIQMPVMDGYTAMREIRALPNSATIHIVALTASAYQEDVEKALASGANSFIPKPFERDQLLLCIADALAITPVRKLKESPESHETPEEATVREMHDFMREQYRISLGDIKMILAQTASDWRPVLDNLTVFTKKGQLDDAKNILHRLKGQLSSIGLPGLAKLASDIMEQIDQGHPCQDNVRQLLDSLSAIFKTLEKQVTIFRNPPSGTQS